MNQFSPSNTESLSPLYGESHDDKDVTDFIPKHRVTNFNGRTCIRAHLHFDETSKQELFDFLNRETGWKELEIADNIEVARIFEFKNSDYNRTRTEWSLGLRGKKPSGKKIRTIFSTGKDRETWLKAVEFIREGLLPPVLFFPNFAVDFPDRIYLSDSGSAIDTFYQRIIQDVLDSLDEGLDVQTHIVERLSSDELDENKRSNAKAVVRKMAKKISSEIIRGWNDILDSSSMDDKEISVEVDVEFPHEPSDSSVYLSFYVNQGEQTYKISERSLGFRWFFCFILFTRFRGERKHSSKALLLFDEPASNLHSTAQAQLKQSLQKILSTGCSIIYSTHSQFMINPQWLENTFVIANTSLDYEAAVGSDLSLSPVNVTVSRYREFANRHPTKTSYFQPLLDVLEVRPADIDLVSEGLLVEGKSDFYIYRYFSDVVLKQSLGFDIIPCFSATSFDAIIGLFLGWRKPFVVLLDDDVEGRKSRDKYVKSFGVSHEIVVTLKALNEAFSKFEVEDLINSDDKRMIVGRGNPGSVKLVKKKSLSRAAQELLALNQEVVISNETKERFKAVFESVKERLERQSPTEG